MVDIEAEASEASRDMDIPISTMARSLIVDALG
jgi:hypothetical protein